jgi:hypothetical protein
MAIRGICLGLIAALAGPPLLGQTSLPAFQYSQDNADLPKPVFRDAETGLPAAIDQVRLTRTVDPEQSGHWQFAWFTYGDNNSRSVTLGLRSDGELFVDRDRDGIFRGDEEIDRAGSEAASSTRCWQTDLDAEIIATDNEYEHIPRSILIRVDPRSGDLEIATAGAMRGTVSVAGNEMNAARMDRDANGRWFDPTDRILLDTNRDGRLDSIGERIDCQSIVVVAGRRYVLQSDVVGDRLKLSELTGVGKIVPRLKLPSTTASLGGVSAALASDGGIRVPITDVGRGIECPVGSYFVDELAIDAVDNETSYWFRFNSDGNTNPSITVAKDQSTEADLLGKILLVQSHNVTTESDATILTIHPRLRSINGLYLTGCRHGTGSATIESRLIAEASIDGLVIDVNSTGFS